MGNCFRQSKKSDVKPAGSFQRSSSSKKMKSEALIKKTIPNVSIRKADINSIFALSSKELGYGQFGSVREARSLADPSLRVALKSVLKAKGSSHTLIQSEVNIWAHLDHPFIAKFYDALEDVTHYHLVIELCEGGSLSTKVKQMGRLAEQESKRLFLQTVLSVRHLHNRGIIHRDIKLSNFLFKSKSPDSDLRLGDFGLACKMTNVPVNDLVGTPGYMAPEIMEGSYTSKVDIWSLGIILYNLLCGDFPFQNGSNSARLKIDTSSEAVQFPHTVWKDISNSAKEMIKRLLVSKPELRPDCDDILSDPWLKDQYQDLLQKGKSSIPKTLKSKLELSIAHQESQEHEEKGGIEDGSHIYRRIVSDVSMLRVPTKEAPTIYLFLEQENQHNTHEQGEQGPGIVKYSTLLELLRE